MIDACPEWFGTNEKRKHLFLPKILEILAPPVLNERGRKEEELVYSISAVAAPHIAFSLLARA